MAIVRPENDRWGIVDELPLEQEIEHTVRNVVWRISRVDPLLAVGGGNAVKADISARQVL